MLKANLKTYSFDEIIVLLLFLYLGMVYFSVAISNILIGIIVAVFLLGIIKKKVTLQNNKEFWILFGLIILPFVLTALSAFYSNNQIKGLRYISLRLPIPIMTFIILSLKTKKESLTRGLSVFVLTTIIASAITIYNAIRYFNEDILFQTDFTHFITIIQHPYFGVYVLLALISILEFDIIKPKPLLFVISIVFVLAIVLTTSRLVYIFLLIVGITYLFKRLSSKKFGFMFLLLSIITVVFFVSNNSISNKFKSSIDYNNSPRLQLWNNSLKVVKESNALFFGIGIGDYYENKKDPYFAKGRDSGILGLNPHSQVIEFYTTNGVFGVTLLFIILLVGILKVKKLGRFKILVFSIIVLFSFTESILSRQYGVQLYAIFIPLILKKKLNEDE